MMNKEECIAANSVSVLGQGILIFGPSGSGKSDLTLRLINKVTPLFEGTSILISDDQTLVSNIDGKLYASPPEQIAGRLEVRGVGVIGCQFVDNIQISMAIDLVDHHSIERIPDLDVKTRDISGVRIPSISLYPFEASACDKLLCIIRAITQGSLANDI